MKELLTHIYVSMISFLLFTITQNMLSVPVRFPQELWTLPEAPWYSLLGICVYHHRKFNFSFWGEMKHHWGPPPSWAEVKWLTCQLSAEVSGRMNSLFIFIQSARLEFTAVLSSWRGAKLVKIVNMSIIELMENLFGLFLNHTDSMRHLFITFKSAKTDDLPLHRLKIQMCFKFTSISRSCRQRFSLRYERSCFTKFEWSNWPHAWNVLMNFRNNTNQLENLMVKCHLLIRRYLQFSEVASTASLV